MEDEDKNLLLNQNPRGIHRFKGSCPSSRFLCKLVVYNTKRAKVVDVAFDAGKSKLVLFYDKHLGPHTLNLIRDGSL